MEPTGSSSAPSGAASSRSPIPAYAHPVALILAVLGAVAGAVTPDHTSSASILVDLVLGGLIWWAIGTGVVAGVRALQRRA
jgi:hypothetical protein